MKSKQVNTEMQTLQDDFIHLLPIVFLVLLRAKDKQGETQKNSVFIYKKFTFKVLSI